MYICAAFTYVCIGISINARAQTCTYKLATRAPINARKHCIDRVYHIYRRVHRAAHTHTRTHTHTHTHTYTYIHTRTHTSLVHHAAHIHTHPHTHAHQHTHYSVQYVLYKYSTSIPRPYCIKLTTNACLCSACY